MKYTIKDFLAGKVDVRCETDEQKKALLKICKDNGILWYGDTEIDNIFPRCPVLEIGYFCIGRLTQSNGHNHRTVVDFSEIALSDAPRYQIVIESDGDTTTAKMVVNGKEVKQATAKRNPADKANWRTGAQVAFDRLWAKQPKPKKPAEKDGFKVGDRVVCISDHLIKRQNSVGQHGRIVGLEYDGSIVVEFDMRQRSGHTCGSKTKDGHGRWLMPKNLRHEQPTKQKVREVKRQAKAGEYIKLVRTPFSFNEVGQILRVDGVTRTCAFVFGRNDPRAYEDYPDEKWHYKESEYVVLEGYQPGRDA